MDSQKVSFGKSFSTATYYFDGSDAAVTDPNAAWTSDTNLTDGVTSNYASNNGAVGDGSSASEYLQTVGTNAPTSGDTIESVRVRIYATGAITDNETANAWIATSSGFTEILGTAYARIPGGGWGDYYTLKAPVAGWTWTTLNNLALRVWATNMAASGFLGVSRVEFEVTTSTLNAESSADFIIYTPNPSYTKTHTTDAYTRLNASPTVAPNSPADASSTSDTTPTLAFTGTDPDNETVRYNVQINNSSTFDSNATTNSSFATLTNGYALRQSLNQSLGQAFTSSAAGKLMRARFNFYKVGTTTGRLVARLYTITGTVGTNAYPVTQLAESYNYVDIDDVPTGSGNTAWYDFYFDGTYSMSASTAYAIVLWKVTDSGFDDASNYIVIYGVTAGGHAGNYVSYNTTIPEWGFNSPDIAHYVYTDNAIITATSGTSAGFSGTPDNTDPFTSGQEVSYTVQSALSAGTYYWHVMGMDPSGTGQYGSWSTTRSFTISSTPSYTVTHTTNALKRKQSTVSHTTNALKRAQSTKTHTADSVLRTHKHYTRGNGSSYPSTITSMANAFYPTDYTTVSTNDGTYVAQDNSSSYAVFHCQWQHTNNTDNITISWNGKSDFSTSGVHNTASLDIWNYNTSSWELIDTDTTTTAGTDFTMTATVNSNISFYYSGTNVVVFRIKQYLSSVAPA